MNTTSKTKQKNQMNSSSDKYTYQSLYKLGMIHKQLRLHKLGMKANKEKLA